MGFDEIITRMRHSFFVIFSGCVLASYAMSLIFGADTLRVHSITAFLLMTVLACLAFFIFYSRKELSKRQMRVRYLVHLLVIIGIMLSAAFYMGWVTLGQPVTLAVFIGTVVAVYIMVSAINEYQSQRLADRMNEKLKERYKG